MSNRPKNSKKKEQRPSAFGVPTVAIDKPPARVGEPPPPPATTITVPYLAEGTTQAPDEDPVRSMTFQIDGGDAGAVSSKEGADPPFSTWELVITAEECPVREAPYTLTVYARNATPGTGEMSRTFIVKEPEV